MSRSKRKLTDAYCRNAKPAASGARDEAMDTEVPGLEFRVTDKGRKSFNLIARYPSSPNRHPSRRLLGEYPALSLENAREKAREWRGMIRQAIDPAELARQDAEERDRQRRAEEQAQENTFEAAAEAFIRRHVKGQRRARDTERDIRRELIPRWGNRQLPEITRRDVIAMVEDIVDRGAPAMARNVLGHAKTLFGWCVARDMLEHSPADRVDASKLIGEKKPRQRVLTDDELVALWRASARVGYPFGPLYRLLLLTGARKTEGSGARWPEFDLAARLWSVPPERFKSDATHLVPLTGDAMAVLEALPRFAKGDHLFSTTFGAVPISGFSKAKARLDRQMLRTMKALARSRGEDPAMVELEPFVIHDIRRTVRTRLAALRVPSAIAEMVIGHGRRGLAGVYDQNQYLDEMREALELWAAKLRGIVTPPPSNVVSFPRSA